MSADILKLCAIKKKQKNSHNLLRFGLKTQHHCLDPVSFFSVQKVTENIDLPQKA